MHEVLVNRLGGLSLPRKSVVRLTDRPDMTLDVYCGRKTTIQQNQIITFSTIFGTPIKYEIVLKFVLFQRKYHLNFFLTVSNSPMKNKLSSL